MDTVLGVDFLFFIFYFNIGNNIGQLWDGIRLVLGVTIAATMLVLIPTEYIDIIGTSTCPCPDIDIDTGIDIDIDVDIL